MKLICKKTFILTFVCTTLFSTFAMALGDPFLIQPGGDVICGSATGEQLMGRVGTMDANGFFTLHTEGGDWHGYHSGLCEPINYTPDGEIKIIKGRSPLRQPIDIEKTQPTDI